VLNNDFRVKLLFINYKSDIKNDFGENRMGSKCGEWNLMDINLRRWTE
jgi:hypothetical protein